MSSPEALKQHYIDQIHENGYVSLGFSISGADIDPLFNDFREFLNICYEEDRPEFAEALNFVIPGREQDGAYWIQRRRIGDVNPHEVARAPATENKDTAHIGSRSLAMAEHELGNKMPDVMRKFLKNCIELHEATKTSVRPAFKALGLEDIMLAPDKWNDVHLIRVLRYIGTTATHKADLHFDRSKFTLAAWESAPGLVGAPGNNAYLKPTTIDELENMAETANYSPIRHYSGNAKLFAGAGYNRLPEELRRNSGHLPLLLHGVKNENPGEERDAVVVFMNQHLGVPGSVARPSETGIDDIREHVLRRERPFIEVA